MTDAYEKAIKMEEGHDASAIGGTEHNSNTAHSSVLRFKDVNFVVGKGEKQKFILQDVSGKVKWGHVLAIMGPSGKPIRILQCKGVLRV